MTSIFCLLLSLVNSKFFHNLYSRQLSVQPAVNTFPSAAKTSPRVGLRSLHPNLARLLGSLAQFLSLIPDSGISTYDC